MTARPKYGGSRWAKALGGAVLLLAAVVGADAEASGQVGTRTRSHTSGDFDGDGLLDRAYGYPLVDGNRGAVVVVYASGKIESWDRANSTILGHSAVGDFFGDAVAAGDIDNDGYEDLVVGVPGDYVSYANSGSINVIYGSGNGLTGSGDQLYHRGSTGIESSPRQNDNFGEFLAVGDFDCDGFEDVVVGVPQDDAQSGRSDDGSLNVIYGTAGGLGTVDDYYHQGVANVSGAPETGDQFGGALAVGNYNGDASPLSGRECMDLAVGLPGEGDGTGFVVFFYGALSNGFIFANKTGLSQDTRYSTDNGKQAGDAFGGLLWTFDWDADAEDDLVVGVPGETCSDGRETGFQQFHGHPGGLVTNNRLNNRSDALECIDWDAVEVEEAMDEYHRCVDFSEPGCGESLTSELESLDRDDPVERLSACLTGIEFALDACEHWLTDPVCDEALCISSSLELSSIADACELEGDVITHGY